MALNKELKEARKSQGYNIEDMAHLLGYRSKASYFNIENNRTRVTLETAVKISKILNKPVDKLFKNFFAQQV